MINKLTPEQEAQFEVYRNRWIDIGLSTNRANREQAEKLVVDAYKVANLSSPTKFFWFDSPAAARKQISLVHGDKDLWNVIYGSHEAGWLSFYDFMYEVVGIKDVEALLPLINLAKEVGWWWPFGDVVYISERPSEIHLDDVGRLHSATGMAIKYADGWGFHVYKGVNIPGSFLCEPITVELIENCANTEQRRVLIELFGAGEYIKQTGAKLESEDEFGKLWSKEVDGGDPVKVVEVINSTPEPDGTSNIYFLRVPPHVKTCAEGVAWTFGFDDPARYMPLVET